MGKTVQNTLKGGATERRGGETKIFKRGRQAGSRGEFLKKMGEGGGLEPPYKQWLIFLNGE